MPAEPKAAGTGTMPAGSDARGGRDRSRTLNPPPRNPMPEITAGSVLPAAREGKNRQVRRMTAKVGFPTLRLIRSAIGKVSVEGLALGKWREIGADAPWSGLQNRLAL